MLHNLTEFDLYFIFCNKACFWCESERHFDVNPRDGDDRDLKLVPNSARMMIASGLRLYKHA